MQRTPKPNQKQNRPNERNPLDQLIQRIAERIVRKLKEMQNQDDASTKCEKPIL